MTKIDAKRCYPANADGSVRKNNSFKGSILFLFGVSLTLSPAFAQAQEFDIDAGPAVIALSEFAAQADVSVVYTYDAVDGLETNRVEGIYEPNQALNLLLAGTSLSAYEGDGGAFAISAREERGASDSKNLNPAPVLMAQNQTSPTTTSNRSDESGTSIVTGKVTDARTGANLKGAKVTIEKTGQWTSTNDLGEFRFVNVPTGSATLTVSYLGYAGQASVVDVRGDGTSQNFALRGGSEIEEIVVFGQRSARALALNQERVAENSTTVLSSDLLGQFNGATLAESLRRAPGITFQESDITGDGNNVIVRGLAPDLNQIRLDGQRLAEGSGEGRSAGIGNFLTESIDEVTISKTLLPNQDSSGTGGLIEITTQGPLDRARRFARFSAETEQNDDFQDAKQFSGTLSGMFGRDDTFGLSASLQYRDAEALTVGYDRLLSSPNAGFGQYLPLAENGAVITSRNSISPLVAFPFEDGVDEVYPSGINSEATDVQTETIAGTLTAQWQPTSNTDLRLSYTRTEQDRELFRRRAGFSPFAGYAPLPVSELDGEIRGAYVWEDVFAPFFPGFLVTMNHDISASEIEETTDVLSFQGETNLGPWDFNYRASGSRGQQDVFRRSWSFGLAGFPPQISADGILPSAFENTIDGRVVSPFAPIAPDDSSYRLPLFNQSGFDFFNDPNNYAVSSANRINLQSQPGENDRQSVAFGVRRNFSEGPLKYLEAGSEFETSRFDFFVGNTTSFLPANGQILSPGDLGVGAFGGNNLSAVGVDAGFFTPTAGDLNQLFNSLDSLSTGPDALLTSQENDLSTFVDEGTFTDEEELALYLQGRVEFGDIEVIGGVRLSKVDVTARSLSGPTLILENGTLNPDNFAENFRRLVDLEGSETHLLPRVAVNYRPSNNLVVRGGYFQSVARPRVADLSGNQQVTLNLQRFFGPNGDQPGLSISQGNPDLRPAVTHSFDASIALYDDDAGVLQASVFYKNIEDFVEFTSDAISNDLSGIPLPDDSRFQNLPDDIFVSVTKPTNNDESAEIFGIELIAERQFTHLPGAWGGFGVYANYTYSDSEKFFVFDNVFDPVSGEFVDVEVSGVPFDQSPKHSGTFAITYGKYGFDGSIVYTAQSERLQSYQGNSLSIYDDSDETLDARLEYRFDRFGGVWRVFVAGEDLLKGAEDPDVLSYLGDGGSAPKYYNRGTFLGGRTLSIGLSVTY